MNELDFWHVAAWVMFVTSFVGTLSAVVWKHRAEELETYIRKHGLWRGPYTGKTRE